MGTTRTRKELGEEYPWVGVLVRPDTKGPDPLTGRGNVHPKKGRLVEQTNELHNDCVVIGSWDPVVPHLRVGSDGVRP